MTEMLKIPHTRFSQSVDFDHFRFCIRELEASVLLPSQYQNPKQTVMSQIIM